MGYPSGVPPLLQGDAGKDVEGFNGGCQSDGCFASYALSGKRRTLFNERLGEDGRDFYQSSTIPIRITGRLGFFV